MSGSSSSRLCDRKFICSFHLYREVSSSLSVSIFHQETRILRSARLFVRELIISVMLLSDAVYRCLWLSAYVRMSGISSLYFFRDC